MADRAAHISSVVEDRASVFEVLAQDALLASLKPALKYVLKIIGQSSPARFGVLYRCADELYSLLAVLLESFYLKHYSGSFAENFYGVKRVLKDGEQCDALPRNVRFKSLAFIILMPYLKDKCSQFYQILLDKQDNGYFSRPRLKFKQKLESLFVRMYPYVHCTWEGLQYVTLLAYILRQTRYHSPTLYWTGVRLEHLTEEDIDRHLSTSRPHLDLRHKSLLRRLLALCKYCMRGLAIGLSSGLSVAVFFLQFVEWWYSSETRVSSLTSLPTPHPPNKATSKGSAVASVPSICPLCNRLRTNDTALAVSGYVFCYPCIYKYVQQHNRCPLTSYPASTEHLVKLYTEEM